MTSSCSSIPLDPSNLTLRAFQAFREEIGISEGIRIHIEKTIPVGGGLGGGSSNAAVTLIAANHLWGNLLNDNQLKVLALKIGSDVPFFLHGGTALGTGRGELLEKIDLSDHFWIVLVCPGIEVSTAWAYAQAKIALTKQEKMTKFRSIFKQFDPHALQDSLVNDLDGVVFRRHPVLHEFKKQFYGRDAFFACMSGSGSTIYGLFSDRNSAEAARAFFSIERGLTTFLCEPIFSCLSDNKNMMESFSEHV